jgi:hypothetical protein
LRNDSAVSLIQNGIGLEGQVFNLSIVLNGNWCSWQLKAEHVKAVGNDPSFLLVEMSSSGNFTDATPPKIYSSRFAIGGWVANCLFQLPSCSQPPREPDRDPQPPSLPLPLHRLESAEVFVLAL